MEILKTWRNGYNCWCSCTAVWFFLKIGSWIDNRLLYLMTKFWFMYVGVTWFFVRLLLQWKPHKITKIKILYQFKHNSLATLSLVLTSAFETSFCKSNFLSLCPIVIFWGSWRSRIHLLMGTARPGDPLKFEFKIKVSKNIEQPRKECLQDLRLRWWILQNFPPRI